MAVTVGGLYTDDVRLAVDQWLELHSTVLGQLAKRIRFVSWSPRYQIARDPLLQRCYRVLWVKIPLQARGPVFLPNGPAIRNRQRGVDWRERGPVQLSC